MNSLTDHFKSLDERVSMTASSSNRPQGTLPGKPETNPKEFCNAIYLRSGREVPQGDVSREARVDKDSLGDDKEEKEEDQLHGQDGPAVPQDGPAVPKERPANTQSRPAGPDDETARSSTGPAVPAEKPNQDHEEKAKKRAVYVPPPYEPKLPFPGRFKKHLLDKYRDLFNRQMEEISNEDSLQAALTKEQGEFGFLKEESNEYEALLDSHKVAPQSEEFEEPCIIGLIEVREMSKEQLPSGEPIELYHQVEMSQEKEAEETEIVIKGEDKKEAEANDWVVKSVIMLNDEESNKEKEAGPIGPGRRPIVPESGPIGPKDENVLSKTNKKPEQTPPPYEPKPPDPLIFEILLLTTNEAMINEKKDKVNLDLGNEMFEEIAIEDLLQKAPPDKRGEFGILGKENEEYKKALHSHEAISQNEKLQELMKLDVIGKGSAKKRKRERENTRTDRKRVSEKNDKGVLPRYFKVNNQLPSNSRFRLFPGNLISRWSGPFRIKEVKPYGAVVLCGKDEKEFVVNGQRLKPYMGNEKDEGRTTVHLSEPQPPH